MISNKNDVFQRLRNGETILPDDPEINRLREASYATMELLNRMNSSSDPVVINGLLEQILGSPINPTTAVFPPLYINYGKSIRIEKNVFVNFGCTFLGLGGITIEDYVMLAPKVSLLSEAHPLQPESRQSLVPRHIHIKKNAWIGANATILPGVTIGENSVVAAGAVVAIDVPDNTVAGGVPARIIKNIQ